MSVSSKLRRSPSKPVRRVAARGERGAQLFEFALVLPLLCVLLVGIVDFAQGFILRHKLTNAAREGARIAIQQPVSDLSNPIPDTVQTVRDAIVEYLDNGDIDVSSIDANPTSTGFREFTYYDGDGNAAIVINRAITLPPEPSGAVPVGTRVIVRYPFSWSFSEVVKLIAPSSSYSNTFLISTEAVMRNIVGG